MLDGPAFWSCKKLCPAKVEEPTYAKFSSEASDCQLLSLTPSRQSAISGCLKFFVATAYRQSLRSGYVASRCCRER